MPTDLIDELERLKKERIRIDAKITELEDRLIMEEFGPRKDVMETKTARGGGSYVLQWVKCGKATCRCAKGGKLHGPYWYHYTKKNGKTICKYVGKKLPAE